MESWEKIEQDRYDLLYEKGYASARPNVLVNWSSINLMDHPRFLDIGCGTGDLAKQTNRSYLGIDVSAVAIEKARRLHPARTFYVGSPLILKTIPNLRCEAVVCNDVLEHVPFDHLKEFLEPFHLVKGNPCHLFCISCREATSLDAVGNQVHRTVRRPEWWLSLLNDLGFEVVKFEFHILKHKALFVEATSR